jgi:hypothetical protein
MDRIEYEVVRHERGWAYRLERTYSQTFPTQWEAVAAAKAAAINMHEDGDHTIVRVQDGPLAWRTELAIQGNPRPRD